jgi:glycosyltransferase involved in cell wall biosynthesis
LPFPSALPTLPLDPTRPISVSVVVINFNYAQYLARAIDSGLAQSYPHTEVLVVDDGSSDGSAAVIAGYGQRVRAVMRSNGGHAAATNDGYAASRGDIVIFLDADDALYPDAVETIVQAWRPGTAKAQFYLDVVDAAERPLGYREPNLPFAAGPVRPHLLAYGYYPSPPTSGNAYHRTALAQVLPASEDVWRMGIDGLLVSVAALYGEVVSVHRALGFYRHHDRNHSEASGTNLAKIRRDFLNELHREAALRHHAAVLGIAMPERLVGRIPGHCKGRLLSLRLDPARHPVPGDRMGPLVLDGIAASWRFPHHGLVKRLAATLGFLALPWVPRYWIKRNLDSIIVARKRVEPVRRLLRRARRNLPRIKLVG